MKNINLLLILLSASILSFSSCTVEDEKDSCENIAGVWKGGYVCAQGATDLSLIITQDECFLTAIFNFSESDNNPGVPSGSFQMEGSFSQLETFDLQGVEWIDQPFGYEMVDILGSVLNSRENIRVSICDNNTVLTLQ